MPTVDRNLLRIGVYELLYLGQAAGVTVMFAGYQVLTGARRPLRPAVSAERVLGSAPA